MARSRNSKTLKPDSQVPMRMRTRQFAKCASVGENVALSSPGYQKVIVSEKVAQTELKFVKKALKNQQDMTTQAQQAATQAQQALAACQAQHAPAPVPVPVVVIPAAAAPAPANQDTDFLLDEE